MRIAIPRNDLIANISYAYLHAVAARAGVDCQPGSRDEDNKGIDADLRVFGPFVGQNYTVRSQHLDIQLKATTQEPIENEDSFSFSINGIDRYNALREPCDATPRFLVVLFLPDNDDEWLEHTEDALILRKCAYWVSLRGAPPSANETSQTVYLPKSQRFTPQVIHELAARVAAKDFPVYQGA